MLQESDKSDGTVGKAMTILDIVESFGTPVRFNSILEKSPFPKPSTYRLLQTLVSQDMLSVNADSGRYALGSRLIRLAHSAWKTASLAPIAAPYIDALSEKIGETIHLAKLDNGQVLYLDKRNARKPIPMFSDAGKIGPVYCTGVGKAMLAFVDEERRERIIAQQSFFSHTAHTHQTAQSLREELATIRTEGLSYDREEHEPNIICIAAPIFNKERQPLGGISITNSTNNADLNTLNKYADDLLETAQSIGCAAEDWMLPTIGRH